MIDFSETIIRKLIVHRASADTNKSQLGDSLYDYSNDEELEILKKIFLKPFSTSSQTYEFKHQIDLELNPLFKISEGIHDDDDFIHRSKDICIHLNTVSKHPNIKDGDLFVVKFEDVKINNTFYEALGIYKIENKESFIETRSNSKGQVDLQFRKGIGSKRLDKACLILFTKEPYTVFIIDSGGVETEYWRNDFLNVNLKNDNINHTNQFLNLTKSFVTERLPSETQVSRADQIDLLNRSVKYFKNNDVFEKDIFEREVLQEGNVINAFRSFNSSLSNDQGLILKDHFNISPEAVKKQARIFKSVLKLDKNFDIYIHGDKNLIERGVETDGRKFYKIYYDQEK